MSGLILQLDDAVVEVGSSVTGEIIRNPDGDGMQVQGKSKARAVRLSLFYQTEGRGDTDTKVVDRAEYSLQAHGGLRQRFSFTLPNQGPVSYDGGLIRVKWLLEARLDLKLARDPKIEQLLLVVPVGGMGAYQAPHPLPKPVGW